MIHRNPHLLGCETEIKIDTDPGLTQPWLINWAQSIDLPTSAKHRTLEAPSPYYGVKNQLAEFLATFSVIFFQLSPCQCESGSGRCCCWTSTFSPFSLFEWYTSRILRKGFASALSKKL